MIREKAEEKFSGNNKYELISQAQVTFS